MNDQTIDVSGKKLSLLQDAHATRLSIHNSPSINHNSPLRVVHIISDLSVGGAEMVLCNLLGALDRTQFEPLVISLMDKGPLRARLDALGIPVYSPRMTSVWPNPLAWLRLLRLVRRLQPDVLQGWMYHSNLAASLARAVWRWRAPVVWSVHYTLANLANERRLTAFVIRLCGRISHIADGIIFVSRTSQEQHAALGYDISRSQVFPNGINLNEFRPSNEARQSVRQELRLTAEAPLIGHIGRYHPMKDHANFLRAARLIVDVWPDARFLLAGRGVTKENTELRQLVHELRLTDCVHLLGERHDIPRVAAALDVFVLASAYGESFPNIIGEAMACGVPCVVTEVGDARWIVGDAGAVVPPRDSAALAAQVVAMLKLDSAARHALGLAARQRVSELFSLDSTAAHYAEVYVALAQGKKAAPS